jgi:hypothetical protein
MVRAYILSEREKEILKRFTETGEKLNGFDILIHYINKYRPHLIEDFDLIETALKKKGTRKNSK